MVILGISGLYHDAAAALVVDGEIVAAAQEERFTRRKHDPSIPINAIQYCLGMAPNREGNGKEPIDANSKKLDYVIFYDDPFLTLQRYLSNLRIVGNDAEPLLAFGFEKMFGERLWVRELLAEQIPGLGKEIPFYVSQHHISHAASAFYPWCYVKI